MDASDTYQPWFCCCGSLLFASSGWVWGLVCRQSVYTHKPHYIFSMALFAGCPTILRCDYSTENVAMAVVQTAFRLNHHDSLAGAKSFMYGPSTRNIVRVMCLCITPVHYSVNDYSFDYISQEDWSWWSQFRRHKSQWWIELCKVSVDLSGVTSIIIKSIFITGFTISEVVWPPRWAPHVCQVHVAATNVYYIIWLTFWYTYGVTPLLQLCIGICHCTSSDKRY